MPGALAYTDADLNIVVCNDRFKPKCIRCRGSSSQPGRPYPEFLRYLAEHGYYGEGDVEALRRAARREPAQSLRRCVRGPHAERQRLPGQPAQGRLGRHGDGDHRHHRAQASPRQGLLEAKQRAEEANKLVIEKNRTLEALSSKLSKYLSPQLYKSIFSGEKNAEVTSQRKKLTIFFSDIAGFTETTDLLESEELTSLLNQYLREMSAIALEYGATIDKFIGDAIMLFFGDPGDQGSEGRCAGLRQDGDRHAAADARSAGRMARARPGARVPASHRDQHRLSARSATSAATTASTTRSSATR